MLVNEEDYLAHYGILRKSGRYPWGSGANPYQRSKTFLSMVEELKAKGLTETEIAKGLALTIEEGGPPFTTDTLRQTKTLANAKTKQHRIHEVEKLAKKGLSNIEIGKKMGINESVVRGLRKPGLKEQLAITEATADMLRRQVKEKKYVDVGGGTEHHVGISETRLKTALAILQDEGYAVHNVQIPQLGTKPGQHTLVKVLAPPGTKYLDVKKNLELIKPITEITENSGRTFYGIKDPKSISSKRIQVVYDKEGGEKADGMIFVRPGVEDVSLGGKKYAQVRVMVDGTHYLKGMAVYKDNMPPGVDIQFYTAKEKTANKLDAMKPLSEDKDNPFGAIIKRQIGERDANGDLVKVTSTMNIVNEEGDWDDWSRKLSTQVLSKQPPTLAQRQLDLTYNRKVKELEEIKAMTNPAIRRTLLKTLADSADSSAVHLEANRIPRSSWHVILPFNSIKDTEVYAPNFRDGERVALIRYPHAGTFEIPELIVNNKNATAKKIIGKATDAVGINHNVAKILSGADFDGDTVLVIPNDSRAIKSSRPLDELKEFDPKSEYKGYEGMTKMTEDQKEMHMGLVSNLITDMTIKGAKTDEIVRAVKHSMVVIDAPKHGLDYKLSAQQNGIRDLMKKYRSQANGGPTIISIASSPLKVPARKMNYKINPKTGEKVWIETGESWVDKKTGKTVYRMQDSTNLAEAKNARTLISRPGTKIESVYADHSNRLKALANEARRELVNTKSIPYSKSAFRAYAPEVQSLKAKIKAAESHRPLERLAQNLANAVLEQKRAANPGMDQATASKIGAQALAEMRRRTGATKARIVIEPREWEAIQSGALTNNMLTNVIKHADIEQVRELATPRSTIGMSPALIARATAMLANDWTQAEVADALGVSVSTLKANIK